MNSEDSSSSSTKTDRKKEIPEQALAWILIYRAREAGLPMQLRASTIYADDGSQFTAERRQGRDGRMYVHVIQAVGETTRRLQESARENLEHRQVKLETTLRRFEGIERQNGLDEYQQRERDGVRAELREVEEKLAETEVKSHETRGWRARLDKGGYKFWFAEVEECPS